jgi:hypothetical protein
VHPLSHVSLFCKALLKKMKRLKRGGKKKSRTGYCDSYKEQRIRIGMLVNLARASGRAAARRSLPKSVRSVSSAEIGPRLCVSQLAEHRPPESLQLALFLCSQQKMGALRMIIVELKVEESLWFGSSTLFISCAICRTSVKVLPCHRGA